MIELLNIISAEGSRQVRQSLIPPVVYLDTWAICEFSENGSLSERFRTALLRSRGTLALSNINLIEFTTFEFRRNTAAAGRFIDSLFPHLFLMTCDPTKVISREDALLAGKLDQSPAGDERALAEFAEVIAKRNGKAGMSVWFNIVHGARDQLKDQLTDIAKVFYTQLRQVRDQLKTDPKRLMLFVNHEYIACGRPPTLPLLQAIVDGMQRDRRISETTNNAVDLLHTVVPAAYCDFVLLDGQWADRLRRASVQLAAASIPLRVRAAYSKRNGGVEKSLSALEGWRAATEVEPSLDTIDPDND